MSPEEAVAVLEAIRGTWPRGGISDAEATAWAGALKEASVGESRQVLSDLAWVDADRRPTPAGFHAALSRLRWRQEVARKTQNRLAELPERSDWRDAGKVQIAEARRLLESMRPSKGTVLQ